MCLSASHAIGNIHEIQLCQRGDKQYRSTIIQWRSRTISMKKLRKRGQDST